MSLLDSKYENAARILAEAEDEVLQAAGLMAQMRLETLNRRLKGEKEVKVLTPASVVLRPSILGTKIDSTSNNEEVFGGLTSLGPESRSLPPPKSTARKSSFSFKDSESSFSFSLPTLPETTKKTSKSKSAKTKVQPQRVFSFSGQDALVDKEPQSLSALKEARVGKEVSEPEGRNLSKSSSPKSYHVPIEEPMKKLAIVRNEQKSLNTVESDVGRTKIQPNIKDCGKIIVKKEEKESVFGRNLEEEDSIFGLHTKTENYPRMSTGIDLTKVQQSNVFNKFEYHINNTRVLNYNQVCQPQQLNLMLNSISRSYSSSGSGGGCGCRQIQCKDRRCGCRKSGTSCGSGCLCANRGSWCLNR